MAKEKKFPLYKIELQYHNSGNWLMFIPSIVVDIGFWCLSIHIQWLWLEMWLNLDPNILDKKKTIVFSPFPCFVFQRMGNDWKEKYNFQFYWLWMGCCKCFGERASYKKSLKGRGYEFSRFGFNKKVRFEEVFFFKAK